MYETVLVPTDGSEGATAAATHAIDLSVRYGATVHVLYVLHANELGLFTPTDVDPEAVKASFRTAGDRALASIETRAEEAGVPVVTELRVGIPHEAIREYTDEEGIDLIVMGTHGRSGFAHALLGSVAERVVRTASVPVMVVRPNADDHD